MSGQFPQMPEGGNGRLKAMLASIKSRVDPDYESELSNHPMYKEGYDDGVKDAQQKYQQLTSALSAVYGIKLD